MANHKANQQEKSDTVTNQPPSILGFQAEVTDKDSPETVGQSPVGEDIANLKDRVAARMEQVKDAIIEGAKSAGETIVGMKDQAAEKLNDARVWTLEKARDPSKTIAEMKESMVEGTRTAGGKLDDIKEWTVEKAKKVDGLLDKGLAFMQQLSEKIDQMKEWSEEKAKLASDGMAMANDVVAQVGDTLVDMRDWTDERVVKVGVTLDKAKEGFAKTGRMLENKADRLSHEIKERIVAARAEITKLETKLQARGDKGGSAGELESIRQSIEEQRLEIGTCKQEMKDLSKESEEGAGPCCQAANEKPSNE